MRDENPELVQPEDWNDPNGYSGDTTPIFLIHDGGGTTLAYHFLNPLFRYVYGIRNPHFWSGDRFEGGLPEMGCLYANKIRNAVRSRNFPAEKNPDGSTDILLGGWSLGGLLSLEISKELMDDPDVRVMGILMIDSVYPHMRGKFDIDTPISDVSEEGKTKNQILSQRAMAEARRMVMSWDMPVWEGEYAGRRPKAVLMRATRCIPTDDGLQPNLLDLCRSHPTLGWSEYDEEMFAAVVEVEGHHFDLFERDRIHNTTLAIRKGLKKLEDAIF